MKTRTLLSTAFAAALLFSSCAVLSKPKYGCGTNGKNVGAERLLDGSAGGKKAPKFKT